MRLTAGPPVAVAFVPRVVGAAVGARCGRVSVGVA